MTTHATGFSTALSNIEPQRRSPGDDAANAKAAHSEVSAVLEEDDKLQSWGLNTKLIGSYARSVSIRRVKDVDVFCRLESLPDHWTPGEVLDHLYMVLLEHYHSDRVAKQHRSIKVDFPEFDLSVDAVPARPSGDDWEVPSRVDSRHRWLLTNPLKLNQLTFDMNGEEDYQLNGKGVYVRVVKLIRQVRRNVLDEDPPGGLFLELMTYWAFQRGLASQPSYAEYLTATLRDIADNFDDVVKHGLEDPTIDDAKIGTQASNDDLELAATRFREAAELAADALAETDECESARLWQRLLGYNCDGSVFPIPDYCESESKSALSTPAFTPNRTPGADRVPDRPGRFA